MAFAERLRDLRRQSGMSQEKLAEKLGVSRQAVTKWESDAGVPELENLLAAAQLFGVTVDQLLSGDSAPAEYLYESVTEYDIDEIKRFDLNLGSARRLVLSGCGGEKLLVRLASDTIDTLRRDCKVKLDDGKRHLDVDIFRRGGLSEAACKAGLDIWVRLPQAYVDRAEAAVQAGAVEVRDLDCGHLELGLKTGRLRLERFRGTAEIDCNEDMEIDCRTLDGAVELNQLSAASRLRLPAGTAFAASLRGSGTAIRYEKDGAEVPPFDQPEAVNRIGFNGIKSELTICAVTRETE